MTADDKVPVVAWIPEGMASFDREALVRDYPEIIKAWGDLKMAKKMFGYVIRGVQP